ncbi:putative aminopeptidase [Pseudozyma hubeiensis]|nr:putative aminopeptidase [Pseudozyma hubeiensis]
MRNFKLTKSVLLAASLAFAASSARFADAAPTVATASTQEWSYWKSDSSVADFAGCASEVAKVRDGAGTSYLYRAPSHEACAQSLSSAQDGPQEVVLFKQEAVEVDATRAAPTSTWKERSLQVLSSISQEPTAEEVSGQMAFQLSTASAQDPALKLISVHDDSLLVAVSDAQLATIDQHATFDTRLHHLIFHPISSLAPLDNDDKKTEPTFKEPKYNTVIAKIASSSALSPARIKKDLRILTGEDPQPSDIGTWHSRHSSTYGARLAAKWIKQQLEESLRGVNGSGCEFFEYSPYFAPNVVCRIPSSSSRRQEGEVIVSAHYDSRGTFGSTTAPGGDDDGSGTAALLAIARSIGSSGFDFHSPIQLIAFSGEEQGLVGSQRYAAHLSSRSTPVKLAVQMDMLAYRKPGEPLQIAFPDKFVTTTATKHLWEIAELYAPELEQGYTPACCSDHQSFWEQGFPATWVFERNGPIADPMYHNSGDVTEREGYDVEQLRSIAKVVVATLLDVAGFDM